MVKYSISKEVLLIMNNYFLERKECHLIQSGTFRKMIDKITGRNSIINLNYMNSAEFEGDALPKSTRRMIVNIDFYDVFTFPEYVNNKGETLKVYAPKMFIEHISKIIDNLIAGNLNHTLKEWCTLPQYLKGENHYNKIDFWWDIENDFYIFFGNIYHMFTPRLSLSGGHGNPPLQRYTSTDNS